VKLCSPITIGISRCLMSGKIFHTSMVVCLSVMRKMNLKAVSLPITSNACSNSSVNTTLPLTRTTLMMPRSVLTPKCWVKSLRTCLKTTRIKERSTLRRRLCAICARNRLLPILKPIQAWQRIRFANSFFLPKMV